MFHYNSRGVAAGKPGGHAYPLAPQKSNSFSFKHQEYCFLRVFTNYTDQKWHNFYRVGYKFWTTYSGFSFFLTT